MDLSIFIARIAAVIYLSVGAGVLLNKSYFRKIVEDYVKSPGAAYLGAMFVLIIGFIMVNYHNVWAWNWTVLITLLGWGAIIKGVVGLIIPDLLIKASEYFIKMKNLFLAAGIISIILGLVFGYFGYLA